MHRLTLAVLRDLYVLRAGVPTTANGHLQGFEVGARWINTLTNPANEYVCTSSIDGAAVWVQVGGEGGVDVTAETVARTAADIVLTNAISSEATTRGNADTALSNALDDETNARIVGVTNVNNDLIAEVARAEAAEAAEVTNRDAAIAASVQTTVRFGTSAPNDAVGVNGDVYIKTDTGGIFARTAGTYVLQASFTPV
jgi:hypothetical protein